MTTKTEVVMLSDISGEPADEELSFALEGHHYEIDVTSKEADELRESMALYIGHARRATSGRIITKPKSKANGDLAKIREWARAQGITVGDRGRIPNGVIQAYNAGH